MSVDMEWGSSCRVLAIAILLPLAVVTVVAACVSAHDDNLCMWSGEAPAASNINKRIMDITHAYRHDLPVWESSSPLGSPSRLLMSTANGSMYNLSELKMVAHTGTHVDAPSHFLHEAYEAGLDVNSLDLQILNGPTLLVDAPREENITARAMQKLNIPFGVERVLFRTLNSDRQLMWRRDFQSDYAAFTKDGAQWLVDHTSIKLVGVDYLSAAIYEDLAEPHRTFFRKRVILVEGLNLDGIEVGIFNLHCLPLRLIDVEGSPIRCIVTQ